jgi:hypothetical protein
MSIVSLATAKEYLELSSTSTYDKMLTRLLDASEEAVTQYLNRDSILDHAFTETRDGTGRDLIQMKNYPLTAITSVTVDKQVLPASAYVVDGTSAESTRTVVRIDGGVFGLGRRNVVISGQAGHTVATVPSAITQVIIETAGVAYKKRTRLGERSKSLQSETISYSDDVLLSNASKSILEPYKDRLPL